MVTLLSIWRFKNKIWRCKKTLFARSSFHKSRSKSL